MPFEIAATGLTDVGRSREHNEDSHFLDDEAHFYVVADGMGGAAAGEVASLEAIDAVLGMVRRGNATIDACRADPSDENRQAVRRLLESAIQAATYMVFGMAQVDPRQQGMGTTLSCLLFVGDRAFVGQVGDSRVYLVRAGECAQLTEDHTLVALQVKMGMITPEQARDSPRGNIITRAVGIKDYVEVDTFELELRHNDRFVLCSDGLHGYIEDEAEIPAVLGNDGLEPAARRFIDLANGRGGKDNITVILAHVRER